MYFDTHAHYGDERFDADRDELLASLPGRGVSNIIIAGTSLDDTIANIKIAETYPYIYAAAGTHPHYAEQPLSNAGGIEELLSHPKVVAIGEAGLDYHYDLAPRDAQKAWFERQLAMAKETGTPIIIHDREAHEDVMTLVKRYMPRAVFHCFSGSAEMARQLVKLGFYISFSGSVTFKNAVNLRAAAAEVPIDRLFIETDCPYLAPAPHRGKRCDSTMVAYTCEVLADIKGVRPDELAGVTAENARAFFGI